jgi:multidrug efflux pump subunit AcrB
VRILDRAIDRPLPVFLAGALTVFFGLVALYEIPVKRVPDVEIPFTFVVVPYPGAAPADIESEITIELEDELNALDRLRHLSSISAQGLSAHIIEFEDRTPMLEALRDVRDRADLAEPELPDDAESPVVQELSFDELPIIFYTLRGGADLYRLRRIAQDLRPALEAVPGVRRIDIFGGLEPEVKVLADPRRLAVYGLTLDDLTAALGRQSRSLPAGTLHAASGERLIRSTGEFRDLEEIRSITIASEAGRPIALRDVATIRVGHVRRTSASWLDAEPSVTLIVKRRHDVNTVETVERLEERVEALRGSLPRGISIQATSDSSRIIGRMIRQLGTSAGFGFVLVIAVLMFTFGTRQALFVGAVLPFSLLATLIGLWASGMEISNIAIFALILVLGLVVDGAIIVGEAIEAEREAGADPVTAAKRGIDRVGLPVIAADLTTIAAFLPMLLMVGVMGQFMSVMPKVVAFALLGSVFFDHLILPAAAARAKPAAARKRPWAEARLSWIPDIDALRQTYGRALQRALARRGRIMGGAALAFSLALVAFLSGVIDSVFLPHTDQSRFTVNFALPLGTPLEETNRIGLLITQQVAEIPEVEHYVLTTGDTGALASDNREGGRSGPEYGRISVELVDVRDRSRSQTEIVVSLRERIERYAGVEIDVDELSEGPGVGAALAIRVLGDQIEEIALIADEVERRIRGLDDATDVRTDYDRSRPEIRISLDRARAVARLGISPDQVSRSLLAAFRGVEVGRMWIDGERVDIRLEAPDESVADVASVRELPLRGADGTLIPLGEVALVDLAYGENAIFRYDTRRSVTVRADAREGASTVELAAQADQVLGDLALPASIALEMGGETEERDRSYASLWRALSWGALLIYCIMAIQFDSLRQPAIVLCAVPLAYVGVTAGLIVTATPFSFMVFIGAVSLTGIVVNDGIVLTDAINRARRGGLAIDEAIVTAARTRLRPVMLTTITTVAGLLPLTLNLAGGGEFWTPLGIALISGLVVSSGLTLFIVPVLYSLIERERTSP